MEHRGITSLRYFLLPGFCGGLGTFSAITYEAVAPNQGGVVYLLLNIVLSFSAVAISIPLSQRLVRQR
jgi:CrcB protein